jgi:hypothetical protein
MTIGRPSPYSQVIADRILDRIIQGEMLAKICLGAMPELAGRRTNRR